MGTAGLGVQVPSIAENSKGEEDLGDDLELIDGGIPENKRETHEDGSDVEPPPDDELSHEQEDSRSRQSRGSRPD